MKELKKPTTRERQNGVRHRRDLRECRILDEVYAETVMDADRQAIVVLYVAQPRAESSSTAVRVRFRPARAKVPWVDWWPRTGTLKIVRGADRYSLRKAYAYSVAGAVAAIREDVRAAPLLPLVELTNTR